MNKARIAHEVDGLKGRVLIDGFRFQSETIEAYFLTHFHGDHYDGLNENFDGPGLIHCTSVTARLVRLCLNVRPELIKEYEMGESARVCGATVTFLDANHCPGAALLLFQLEEGGQNLIHLHTGDMRAHPSMQQYPPLVAARGKIDKIYLDTTYCHPKHTFQTQEASTRDVADSVEEELAAEGGGRRLFLISSYKIGKERVMIEVAKRTGKRVYVDENKMRIVRCLGLSDEELGHFTSDMKETPIHVCRMGFAGDIWPYFQPKFPNIDKYIKENELGYDSCVAYIPTGWAEGSNYNKRNAVKTHGPHKVVLVPYSEHSNYPELIDFVKFLKPKQVVPTVFSDEKVYREIVARFSNLVDRSANMQAFISSMGGGELRKKERGSAVHGGRGKQGARAVDTQDSEAVKKVVKDEDSSRSVTSTVEFVDLASTGTVVVEDDSEGADALGRLREVVGGEAPDKSLRELLGKAAGSVDRAARLFFEAQEPGKKRGGPACDKGKAGLEQQGKQKQSKKGAANAARAPLQVKEEGGVEPSARGKELASTPRKEKAASGEEVVIDLRDDDDDQPEGSAGSATPASQARKAGRDKSPGGAKLKGKQATISSFFGQLPSKS